MRRVPRAGLPPDRPPRSLYSNRLPPLPVQGARTSSCAPGAPFGGHEVVQQGRRIGPMRRSCIMTTRTWWHFLPGHNGSAGWKHRRPGSRQCRGIRPAVEPLEDRLTPSGIRSFLASVITPTRTWRGGAVCSASPLPTTKPVANGGDGSTPLDDLRRPTFRRRPAPRQQRRQQPGDRVVRPRTSTSSTRTPCPASATSGVSSLTTTWTSRRTHWLMTSRPGRSILP